MARLRDLLAYMVFNLHHATSDVVAAEINGVMMGVVGAKISFRINLSYLTQWDF
jgi:hypothetical protein